MDDMDAFERQLASVVLWRVGPAEPVDDAAIYRALTTATRSDVWRVRSMSSATRFVVAVAMVVLIGGILISTGAPWRQPDQRLPAGGVASPATSAMPAPPAMFEALWPGFRLLSNAEAGVSIQVPERWGRGVVVPPGFDMLLQEGTGNAGLNVLTPRAALDLEATVALSIAVPGVAGRRPYTRIDVMHGTHRAVRLESLTTNGILYVVERDTGRPVVVGLGWDGVPDLGYVEEAILRSLNVDGSNPAILASYTDGSSSFVTMTSTGCTAVGPRFTSDMGTDGVSVANLTPRIGDFNLLEVGSGYSGLEADVRAAAEAIVAGQEPTWPNSSETVWISDTYLQPQSGGTLTAAMLPGVYAVMCFPVGEHDESLGVYLTLPFEVVAPEES
jgi:hypothetical protein